MSKPVRPIRIEGDIAYVPLTKGYEAIIDAEDVEKISFCNWYAEVALHTVYAAAKPRSGKIYMHRILTNSEDCHEVDHEDGNGLRNQKGNLRIVTRGENAKNHARRHDNRSGVKGVRWASGKWRARIRTEGKEIDLGRYERIEDAAAAYRAASQRYHGEFGCADR